MQLCLRHGELNWVIAEGGGKMGRVRIRRGVIGCGSKLDFLFPCSEKTLSGFKKGCDLTGFIKVFLVPVQRLDSLKRRGSLPKLPLPPFRINLSLNTASARDTLVFSPCTSLPLSLK